VLTSVVGLTAKMNAMPKVSKDIFSSSQNKGSQDVCIDAAGNEVL